MSDEEKTKVRLEIAHVLFIDIVGYSKLRTTQQSEFLRELNEIVGRTKEFQEADAEGKLIRLPTGDGMALVFRTNPEAPAQCALEISQALRSRSNIQLRMGIHSGPVNEVADVNQRANIAGTGINIAQRVMDCGDPGHILISKHAAEDLEQYDHWQPHLHDLGECEVKHGVRLHVVNLYTDEVGNPALPQKFPSKQAQQPPKSSPAGSGICLRRWILGILIGTVVVVAALGIVRRYRARQHTVGPGQGTETTAALAAAPEKSIAVLPFANLSRDPDNAYFAAGIQDEIITRLSKIAELKVISCTSTQRFKSSPDDIPAIAAQLGVANILEGSVQRTADAVRVNVQLIRGATDTHLWADTFDRKLADIFAVESEISKTIAATLQAKLTGSQQNAIAARPTDNTEAYQLYLKGRFFWNKRTGQNLNKAADYFNQAIAADPVYALAYVGLADSYLLMPLYGAGAPQDCYPRAKAAAEKALQLDGSSAEAHTSRAQIFCYYDLDFTQAIREFQRAIELNANYPTAHQWYGSSALAAVGRFDQAITEVKRAIELDPLSLVINTDMGNTYYRARRYDEAIDQMRKTLEMDPGFYYTHWNLGSALAAKGNLSAAIEEYLKARALNDDPSLLGLLAHAYAVSGNKSEAMKIRDQLEALAKQRYVSAYTFTLVYLGLGDKELALRWLERAYQDRAGDSLRFIKVEPLLDALHGDPRFEALAEKMVPAREFAKTATTSK
jgi:TolB-like protein/class 3 adenylate cyclase/Tfp pilus assembly protein PilF